MFDTQALARREVTLLWMTLIWKEGSAYSYFSSLNGCSYYIWQRGCLILSWRGPLSYRNQSIDLDLFLYDNGLCHERVNESFKVPSLRTRTCLYKGVRNVSFSENFTYVLNVWSLNILFFIVISNSEIGSSLWFFYSISI